MCKHALCLRAAIRTALSSLHCSPIALLLLLSLSTPKANSKQNVSSIFLPCFLSRLLVRVAVTGSLHIPTLATVFVAVSDVRVALGMSNCVRCPPRQLMDAYCSKKNLPTTGYVFMVDE